MIKDHSVGSLRTAALGGWRERSGDLGEEPVSSTGFLGISRPSAEGWDSSSKDGARTQGGRDGGRITLQSLTGGRRMSWSQMHRLTNSKISL